MLTSAFITLRDRGLAMLLKAVANLAYGNFCQLILKQRFVQRKIYDYRLWLDMEDRGISRTLLLFGERELEHKAMLEQIARPGMRVFDIGANIGYYAIMESRLIGPQGMLLAIEPSPANVALLKRNLELNSIENIVVQEGAVSSESGRKDFHLATQSNLNTFHDTGTGVAHLSGKSVEVNTYTVPQLAHEHGAPDLLRMDVEGHEVQVLKGMIDDVRAGAMMPVVIFETHLTRYREDNDFEPVLRQLFECGYHVSLAASSWENGTKIVNGKGYSGIRKIRTDGVERELFENISDEDAIEMICRSGGLRTVVLASRE